MSSAKTCWSGCERGETRGNEIALRRAERGGARPDGGEGCPDGGEGCPDGGEGCPDGRRGVRMAAERVRHGRKSGPLSSRAQHRTPGTSSVFRLPSSVFRLPSSVFRLPSSVFRLRLASACACACACACPLILRPRPTSADVHGRTSTG
ncbi:uncharacterized protein SOCEGT47_019920 [Sorangium cellulosum]|uniref:Uncharacterized protein n=1 Tax=Sorangium cellulosum TaxID=56 RepID=A0A4P2PY59_SORCE|nr:uncharacterized protein SOCEGT47_019920 [Sorangium cellulosum]